MVVADVLGFAALLAGVMMGVSNFPQFLRAFRRKSAKDLSMTTYAMLTAGGVVWFAYGVSRNDLPIMISNAIGAVLCMLVLAACMKYK